MQYSQEHLKTMVYAKFGGQTECIMGNWKIENYRVRRGKKRNCCCWKYLSILTANSTTVFCLNFDASERLFFVYCSFVNGGSRTSNNGGSVIQTPRNKKGDRSQKKKIFRPYGPQGPSPGSATVCVSCPVESLFVNTAHHV